MICPSCGIGEVVEKTGPGRRWPHKTIPDLELPSELTIPTCTECGEEWIDDEVAQRIADATERAYAAALAEKAEAAIRSFRRTQFPQRMIERLLGVSHGYFSKILSAEREPSPHLVAALMLLANDPDRIEELRKLWSTKVPEPIRLRLGAVTVANPASAQRPATTGIKDSEIPLVRGKLEGIAA